eukprot:TRINITY_DN46569_c0_g1_i1.p1 TRINITY_DN46569_c0_g1~~TRINITY_DN46569_c0_g1_i1.p1  ORF type:complete len:451 (+),score=112.13 TRINITY_DN46569_c0_g1_i1:50-1402(+)
MYNSSLVAGRYRTGNEVGKGAFARVFRSIDTHTNRAVAMKILKRDYTRDAAREVEVLSAVNKNDPEQTQRVCRMQCHFTWEGQPVIIFQLHGPALRSRRFGSGDKAELARLAKQLASALDFCHHRCRIVHTDLKPENILLENPNPSGTGLGEGWKICDLGSASFYTERVDKELITTRPYRAPEVILGSGWCYPADMFSLGVILYEVFTGRTVFECTRYCDSDAQHLQQMERRLGSFSSWMVDGSSSRARNQFFDVNGRLRQGAYGAATSQPVTVTDPELQDLIIRLLHYDPVTRLRADEVLHHPFVVRYMGHPESAIHASMPPNAYASGFIRTPGCTTLRSGRIPANKLAPEEVRTENRGRSSSMKVPKDRMGAGILGDLTNRPAAGLPSGGVKRAVNNFNAANMHIPRPRCGSAMAGARGLGAAPAAYGNFWEARDPIRQRAHDAWLYR